MSDSVPNRGNVAALVDPAELARWTVGGLVLNALPFLGAMGSLGIGMAMLVLGSRRSKSARMHLRQQAPTPISEARIGRVLTLRGTIESEDTETGPLSGERGCLVQLTMSLQTSNVGHEETLSGRTLGGPFLVAAQDGEVLVHPEGADLSVEAEKELSWSGRQVPAELIDYVHDIESLDERRRYTAREKVLRRGDEVWVTGAVSDARELSRTAGAFRSQATSLRVVLTRPADGPLRITTRSPAALAREATQGRTFVASGVVWIVLSVVSGVTWAWVFLR